MVRLSKYRSLLLAGILFLSIIIMTEPSSRAINPENSWEELAPMPVARSDLGLVAAANGKLYAIGGNTENGDYPYFHDYLRDGWISNANEEYNPINDSWTIKASMPTPRYAFAIATFDDKIYCMGGVSNWNDGYTYSEVNEVYDPSTDTWETKTSLPIAISGDADVIENKIYVIGQGSDRSNGIYVEVYEPLTDTWTVSEYTFNISIMPPPNTVNAICSVAFDGKIHVFNYAGFLGIHRMYDPVNNSWINLDLSVPPVFRQKDVPWWSQAAISTTGHFSTRQIYVFSAPYGYLKASANSAYNPVSDEWVRALYVPTERRNFAVAILNDTIYAVGGRTYDYPTISDSIFTVEEKATNERYTPFGYGAPDPTAPTPSPTIPEQSFLSIMPLLIVIPLITFFFVKKYYPKTCK